MTNFRVEGIDHAELFVRDIDAAIRWYGDVSALSELHRWIPKPVMIGAGGAALALSRARPGVSPSCGGDQQWR
jgi:catechol 2,3-dioxygenase-like lactoylglutathione lyase family enzyme